MSFFFKSKKNKESSLTKEKKDKKSSSSKKMSKSKLTIESLPNIILGNILTIVSDEYHDNVSSYRLVCKLWSDIIVKQVPVRINFNKQLEPVEQASTPRKTQIPLGFYHVHRTIVKFSKISYLSLRSNKTLDVDLLLDLFNGKQKKFSESLVHLDIGKMELNVRDPKMALINTVLKNFPNLSILDCSENDLDSKSIQSISDSLSNNSSLTCLNLSLNPIGDIETMKLLGQKIFKDSRNCIRFLNLIGCGINRSTNQDDTASNALESLFFDEQTGSLYPKVHKLHSLLLGHNPLQSNGSKTIEKLLSKNDSLKYLDLEYCSLKTDGFLSISNSLLLNSSLEYLNVTSNQIEPVDDIIKFQDSLESNHNQSNLKHLDTTMNKWQYQKRLAKSDSFLFPISCLKHYDNRYTLVDVLNSIQKKGYYCPILYRSLSIQNDKPLYSQKKCE